MKKKITIISMHPHWEQSYGNKRIVECLLAKDAGLRLHRLDQTVRSDFTFDIAKEQEMLCASDVLVFQSPFYWYSWPTLGKRWIDDVLTYNFAYGPLGDKLKGKTAILSLTTGGPKEAYTPTGYNRFPLEELLKPIDQTFHLCSLRFHPERFVTHGVKADAPDLNALNHNLESHAKNLYALLESL